MVDLR